VFKEIEHEWSVSEQLEGWEIKSEIPRLTSPVAFGFEGG
jgi:hypothetical protein